MNESPSPVWLQMLNSRTEAAAKSNMTSNQAGTIRRRFEHRQTQADRHIQRKGYVCTHKHEPKVHSKEQGVECKRKGDEGECAGSKVCHEAALAHIRPPQTQAQMHTQQKGTRETRGRESRVGGPQT